MSLGESMRRLEDPRLLKGEGCFVGDLSFPGMLEAHVVRSPYAHADIVDLDTRQARALPGVIDIITGDDLPKPLPRIPVRLSPAPELLAALQTPLASGRVRYVGEPVAMIVAKNRYVAEDAADLVQVRYRALPVVADLSSVRQGAPPLHTGVPSNLVYQRRTVKGDPERAFREAPCRLRWTFSVQRHTGVPLETRGLVSRMERGRLAVFGPTKVVHFNRQILAGLLSWPLEKIRFVEPDVGGGFGIRGEFYPEDYLVPFMALRLNRPIRWIEDRIEHMKSANHSRQQEHRLEVAFTREGRLLALRDEVFVDSGAYIRTHGVTVPELTQAMLPGPYDWPALDIEIHVGLTNKTPTGTYRGPGRFEGTFVRERALDGVAQFLGMDPAKVRRINFIPPDSLPYTNGISALGQEVIFDSGDYTKALGRVEEMMDYQGFVGRQGEAREAGKLRGFGIACFVEKSGLGPWEIARCRLTDRGQFECYTGLAALGQGTETMLAQVVADGLGIRPGMVRVLRGDTDVVPEGHGSFASRGTVMGGTAAHVAAGMLADRLREVGAHMLEASADDVEIVAEGIGIRGVPSRMIAFVKVAQKAPEFDITLDVQHRYQAPHMTYPYGVHAAEVEVDPDTGAITIVRYGVVYDIGKAINPATIHGQIVGGVAQGLGGALLEALAYDDQGQLLSATLMDYLLPGAGEVPDVDVAITEDAPSLSNPLGVKGAGEGGTVGVAPALANAVARAIGAPVEALTELPLTPERVRQWIKKREEFES